MQYNPFLSTPEAVEFWREQRKACEEARRMLVSKYDKVSNFLSAGGKLEVVPYLYGQEDDGTAKSFAAILKDGDSLFAAIHFVANKNDVNMGLFERLYIAKLTNWLNEASGNIPADAEGYYYQEQEQDPTDNPEYPFK